MKYVAIYLMSLLSVIGCKSKLADEKDVVYFGGEIINPKSDKVIIYNPDGKITDTLYLDTNNRFLHKMINVEPGLFSFRHGEYQMVILEPNDSIMIRLNTNDFDESLVFTGKGARKNNYLLETFLRNEKQDRKLVKYSQMDPESFNKFITKRHQKQRSEFEDFIARKDISDFSKSVIKASIDYNNYADKEIYPFAYFGNNKLVHVKDLPENFYSHRQLVNYNARHLSEVFAYNRFLFSHFDNLALKSYYKDKAYHSKFNRHEISYNIAKLNLIDSMISDETIKNNLLKYKTRYFINHCENEKEINDILAYYQSKTTNPEHVAYMIKHVASLNKLKPGNGLPDIKLVNINNEEHTIASIVKQPSLIYFWSTNYKEHYRNSHYRVKELKKKFPEMAFISININDNTDNYWIETLNKYKFSLENEYKFKNPKEALNTLAVNYVYKVIIVDENTNIIHPNVNIFNDDFEMTLTDLMQKKELSL